MKITKITTFALFCSAFFVLNGAGRAWAVTTTQWVDLAESWWNASDNGKLKTVANGYRVDESGHLTWEATITTYFQDDVTNGWSVRIDKAEKLCSNVTCTTAYLSTPSGDEMRLNGSQVIPPDTGLINLNPDHATFPKAFFDGIHSQSSVDALDDMSTAKSVTTESIDNISCWRLDFTANNNSLNDIIEEGDIPSTVTFKMKVWIKSSYGTPVQTYLEAEDNSTHEILDRRLIRYTSIDDNPTIPSGTFDLIPGDPSVTLEDALADWVEANCAQ